MILRRFTAVVLCLLFVLSVLTCCSERPEGTAKISVVATLFPQYDFARAILGDKGEVTLLLAPGANSHSFELTASDISKINNCDVFVYTGPNMEIWADGIVSSINSEVDVVNLSESLDLICTEEHDHTEEHSHGEDPHIWTSPVIAKDMLLAIYNAICNADAENKEYYTENYEKYLAKLNDIDSAFRDIASMAENKTLYFSGKFAFLYFVNEYGFDYVAPFNSCSDMQVEDLASVANLISEMKNNNIEYIFYEEFAGTDLYTTISEQTGATPMLLHSAHNVSKDDFEKGITYIDIMMTNIQTLKRALLDG